MGLEVAAVKVGHLICGGGLPAVRSSDRLTASLTAFRIIEAVSEFSEEIGRADSLLFHFISYLG